MSSDHNIVSADLVVPVHEYVEPLLAAVGQWPMVGTPEWCALPDNDARKIASIYDAAQHHALRIETCQEARAEASHAVAGAADWSAIARAMMQRNGVYIPRKAAS